MSTAASSSPSRRQLLRAGLVLGSGAALTGTAAGPAWATGAAAASAAPGVVRSGRAALSHGVASGDVTARSAVLWGRADAPGRLWAEVLAPGRDGGWRRVPGPAVDAGTDLTGTVRLKGLRAGETYEYRLVVETADGFGPPTGGLLTTVPDDARDVSFAWTGDTAGQGWGRHVERGMPGYAAIAATQPDFWVHSGDTVYADGVMAESVALPDGSTWRNVVTDGVDHVAQTLEDYRGRHRYNCADPHVQALAAQVPVYVQWDDHEVTNNWYPGEVLTDERYTTERSVDVLARRAKQAFTEYYPLDTRRRDTEGKVYGKFSRGPHLDVFLLDMRTYRGANTPGTQPAAGPDTRFLGAAQVDWLVQELSSSTATWKAVMADMPLGVVVPDGSLIEAVAQGDGGPPRGRELEVAGLLSRLKAAGVRNTVWFTADVHYAAAHRYDPARVPAGGFTDFDPFWEFVGGPVNAGVAPAPNALDATFGPEQVFAAVASGPDTSPASGDQFFGHVRIAGDGGQMTVSLEDATGATRFSQTLDPQT